MIGNVDFSTAIMYNNYQKPHNHRNQKQEKKTLIHHLIVICL